MTAASATLPTYDRWRNSSRAWDVGDVHLDDRSGEDDESVHDRDRGVGVGAEVADDDRAGLEGLVDPVDEQAGHRA
jgi:hypothetical protein